MAGHHGIKKQPRADGHWATLFQKLWKQRNEKKNTKTHTHNCLRKKINFSLQLWEGHCLQTLSTSFTFAALCQTESPLTGSTPWKGAVCNTAQQIESASQLKRHTYLIRPVIQGHALLPLHNTLSLFVTTAPQGSVKLLSFDLLQRKAGSTPSLLLPPLPIFSLVSYRETTLKFTLLT